MATSKLKVITKTLKKAIDYIVNPEKTKDGTLVYSHGCSVGTADREMELTAKQGTGLGNRIAYHLIQSFAPDDDITPEKALELGIEYARKVTGGRYEFVVSTHVDRGHIHNHIIFNAVDYVNHRKYHSDEKDKYRIRDINDEICKANNLSVLPKYIAKRKSKYENRYKNATPRWRSKLKKSIDQAILQSESFEDFLFVMEMEGYKIKKRGKSISLRDMDNVDGSFLRLTSLDPKGSTVKYYTEEAIRERIANKENEAALHTEQSVEDQAPAKTESLTRKAKPAVSQKRTFSSKRINLLVDIKKNIKAQQSKGYEQALVRSNINTLVKTMNFLISHKITTSEDFLIYAEGKQAEYSLYREDINKLEREMLELSEKIKFTQNYKKNASVFYESKRSKDPAAFAREHEEQLVLFRASQIYFDRHHLNPKELNLTEMFERYKSLRDEKDILAKKGKTLKSEISELEVIAENIEQAIGVDMKENAENTESIKRENGQETRNIENERDKQ